MSAPVYKRSRHGLLPVEWNYDNGVAIQYYLSGFESSNLGSASTILHPGSKGQITTHLANQWNASDGHGTTANLGGTGAEILMIVFTWPGAGQPHRI